MRDGVRGFSSQMEHRLLSKDEDYGHDGWLGEDCSVKYLINKLEEKAAELKCAYEDCNPLVIETKCIDIGNFAMMIRDRLQLRDPNE